LMESASQHRLRNTLVPHTYRLTGASEADA
jgi:hypothetical protein